jgi:hypothetical protein
MKMCETTSHERHEGEEMTSSRNIRSLCVLCVIIFAGIFDSVDFFSSEIAFAFFNRKSLSNTFSNATLFHP